MRKMPVFVEGGGGGHLPWHNGQSTSLEVMAKAEARRSGGKDQQILS